MDIISRGSRQPTDVHAVRSRQKMFASQHKQQKPHMKESDFRKGEKPNRQLNTRKLHFTPNGCYRCGGSHQRSDPCPAKSAQCRYCGKTGHFLKVCIKRNKQLHEINSPDDIHHCDYETDNTRSSATIGSVTSVCAVDTACKFPDKLFVKVKLNDSYTMNMKIDTGADTCILTTDDLQTLPFEPRITSSDTILSGYGGSIIKNVGVAEIKVSYKQKSIVTKFNIVNAPSGSPSMLGCSQAQELGLITVNIDHLKSMSILTREKVLQKYKECFDKIGKFPGEKYHIELVDDPKPVIHPPRAVPVHIMPLYKAELEKMKADDIITEVTEPTEWVNSITCRITKGENDQQKIRLCLDPKDLNKNIKRAHYPTRTIDELLPLQHGKKYFSVIDTKKGYWHEELDYESSLLCTFNTPFGRYRFKRLPFGLVVSQDIFQRKLDSIFNNIANVSGIADDLIISGATEEEHDEAFIKVMEAAKKNNIGFNSEKLQFKQNKVSFYGHTLTEDGLLPSEDKLQAIKDIQAPTSTKELQTLLGMVTYLNRFSTKLAELVAPLRELNKKNVHFRWEPHHQQALDDVKKELCTKQLISYYDSDPNTVTILQCDASTLGLGAWIRQIDQHGQEKIVGMASRCLSPTESRYSNIERECLAVMFGLEKFEYYLLGRQVMVETDHSPLEQIFKKNLAETPTRLQRFILRCLKFDIEVKYKPGRSIPLADALSRICQKTTKEITTSNQSDVHFISTATRLVDDKSVREAMADDPTMNMLKDTIYKGWPQYRKQCPPELWEYWTFRCDLVLEDGLILKGERIVIPKALRNDILDILHTGHQGETKCILLARESVFWPGISSTIREMVKGCHVCSMFQPAQQKLPVMQPDLPTRPWEILGSDIFEFDSHKYLIIVDYYSRFPVVRLLPDISARTVCTYFKSVLGEHGLPSTIIADCGTQYVSEEFKKRCEDSNITLKFSSPYHHQANSVAERAVGTVKALWKKAKEDNTCPYTALWMYRITPLDDNMPSPYELLYGRKPKSLLPISKGALLSHHPHADDHLEMNRAKQVKQQECYDMRAGKERSDLQDEEQVYVRNTLKKIWEPGTILNRPNPIREPRTYLVDIEGKTYQRTREHLKPRHTETPSGNRQSISPPTDESIPVSPPYHSPEDTTSTISGSLEKTTLSSPQKSGDVEIPKVIPPLMNNNKGGFQMRSQSTRSGRITRIPLKFNE
uniref:Gypsy retrotransposon integrase-like protein 1 n=1 Tax=Oryzias latipes TaxID=8090 RepID=A0A3P9KLT8_ORYLA